MKLSILVRFSLISCLAVSMAGCASNQKKGDDLSAFNRMYQNTTARYNGYFNAGLIMDNTYVRIEQSHKDNFNQVLPLYTYAAYDDSRPFREDLDEVIKKVSIVITKRRQSRWADECYLMMGEAQFLKKDYEAAEEVFRYLTTEYDPTAVRNRGRYIEEPAPAARRGQPARGSSQQQSRNRQTRPSTITEELPNIQQGIGNTLVYKEGLVWLAKTLTERGFYDRAMVPINRLKKDEQLPKHLISELAKAEAHNFLKQRRYANAIEPLERAIAHESDKGMSARMNFILAQIYEIENRPEMAVSAYEQVLRARTDYEMDFSARLNMLRTAYFSGKESSGETERLLARMLRDEKNKEFEDKIHYALAEVYLREGDRPKALAALQASLAAGGGSSAQAVETYYLLASLHFDEGDYIAAKNYYDQTLGVMPRDDHRYNTVEQRSNNLTDIAVNLQIIQNQDSLLSIRNMSQEERIELAKSLRPETTPVVGAEVGSEIPGIRVSVPEGAVSGQSSFWAYNPQNVDRGMREFRRTWGDRSLEDDWRRSQRTGIMSGEIEEIALLEEIKDLTEEEMAEIFKEVPRTDEDVMAAEKAIADAKLQLGSLFREKINDTGRSIEVLEKLLERFPNYEKTMDALYFLYIAYMDVDPVKSDYYKNEVIRRYPDSNYAKFLSDPSAMDAYTRARKEMESYYDVTYGLFQNGEFELALQYAVRADSLFAEGYSLRPRFALLSAMCMGHTGGTEAYRQALRDFIANFPRTPEEMRAREILRILDADGSDTAAIASPTTSTFSTTEFTRKTAEVHYMVIHITAEKPNLNNAQVKISDYNKKYHNLASYRVSSLMLDLETSLVVVRSFDSEQRALSYFKEAKKDLNEFVGTSAAEPFIIGQENYRNLLRNKNLEGYKAFFKETYK